MNSMQGDMPTLETVRALIAARRLDEAETSAETFVAKHPNDAEGRFILGSVQAERRNFAAALGNIQRSLAADRDPPWTRLLALVNVLRDSGDARGAEAVARRLVLREPARVQAQNALGLALHDQARFDEAIAVFRHAATMEPAYVGAQLNLALALEAKGNLSDAIAAVQAALERIPNSAALALAFATLLDHAKRRDEASEWYLRAARMDPNGAAEAYRRLGRLLYSQADIFSAIAAYEQYVKLRDDNAEVWNVLGNAYMDVAAIAHATRCYTMALSIDPTHAEIFDNLLLCHHYNPAFTAQRMFDEHKEWARRFTAGIPHQSPSAHRIKKSLPRLRIGFVSQSLCRGPTGFFLLPLLRHLDRKRHEIFCYSAGFTNDEISDELRRHADSWRDVGSDDDAALAARISADGIDILIDLAGHAPGNRLRAIARKPAPIVVTWLDYFDTTGLDCVDFLIADSVSVPATTSQRFTETVLRVEPSRLCYAPPAYAPVPTTPPVLRNGFITFGSFNRLAKLAEPVVDLWARLLHAAPGSRLLLKSAAFNHPTTSTVFAKRFAQRGIGESRLELRGSSPHAEMLAAYGDIDIALDPFPYNGGLTTCEALWMGVPVVALDGDSMISRQSAALLRAAACGDWVAQTQDEWLGIATGLSSQIDRLCEARRSLRSTVASSPLVDGFRFAKRFEALLESMHPAGVSGVIG